eukprot:8591702-Pyramimonas_sp.AAC.1
MISSFTLLSGWALATSTSFPSPIRESLISGANSSRQASSSSPALFSKAVEEVEKIKKAHRDDAARLTKERKISVGGSEESGAPEGGAPTDAAAGGGEEARGQAKGQPSVPAGECHGQPSEGGSPSSPAPFCAMASCRDHVSRAPCRSD